jgi:isoleucyl-tRNA synthetase
VATRILAAFEDYDYPGVYHAASQFITVDLSAFYVDVTKDRMYTFGAKSEARRSGQTAMFLIADGLSRLLAPILPFTMDELWRNLPGERASSVHLSTFPRELTSWADDALLTRWEQLAAMRNLVNAALEARRQDKTIKSNLSARVTIAASGDQAHLLAHYRDELPALFGVSQVEVQATTASEPDVRVDKADGVKCERCWRIVPAVNENPEFRGLCERCVGALAETVNSAS